MAKSEPGGLGDVLSIWMIAPLIFLIVLLDTGNIKRGLLSAVPNRLFEPALAVLADVDEVLGNYVRGIFLECCALGLTVSVLIIIVGVPLRWAIAIGIFTGASNVVPYMGFAAALLSGLAYALLAENVHPLIPLVTAETFAIWVVVAVALAELLKNVFYEPIVLGGAVKLHPLVVVIGVVGGAILFGPAGMFLAISTLTIVRVLAASSARHLKAYGVVLRGTVIAGMLNIRARGPEGKRMTQSNAQARPTAVDGASRPSTACLAPIKRAVARRRAVSYEHVRNHQFFHCKQAYHLQLPRLSLVDPQARLPFPNHDNLHVRGYEEKGNINTPLELAILNQADRFNLVIGVIDRMPRLAKKAAHLKES